ncbi:hypothetical protein [uncultured Dysgonomonas sp.]|uniref:hypothetical protein n=1 Tax=uncultured Dysgonomonas sp. TaxID=206096 RepID=UPI0025E402F3|nr:hypothetical protein [uncultured Dysgonomonas sp.]
MQNEPKNQGCIPRRAKAAASVGQNNTESSLAGLSACITTALFCPTPPLYGLGTPPAGRGRNRDATTRQCI